MTEGCEFHEVDIRRSVRKILRDRQGPPRWRFDDRSVVNVTAILPDDEEGIATKNTKRHKEHKW